MAASEEAYGAGHQATFSPERIPASVGGASEEAYGAGHQATFSRPTRQRDHRGEPSEIGCPQSCCNS